MQRVSSIGAVTLTVSVLAGCAVYDRDAWPAAASLDNAAYAKCNARVAQHEIATHAGMIECYLAADEAFARAISLQRPDLFRDYAKKMRQIGVDADAGRVTGAEMRSNIAMAQASFRQAINQAYVETQAAQGELVGNIAAFGRGYADGMAAHRHTPAPAAALYNPQPQLAPNGTHISDRGASTLCPNGTYVAGDSCQLAPDGSYVSGSRPIQLAPNGTYTSGSPQLAPNGTYTGPGQRTLCPNGTYVTGSCHLQPNGQYTGD